uniref:DUF2514 family protein n=1 Tax=Globodera pallida TaxID=36090 RepID=A0A183C643_GLOPA
MANEHIRNETIDAQRIRDEALANARRDLNEALTNLRQDEASATARRDEALATSERDEASGIARRARARRAQAQHYEDGEALFKRFLLGP